MAITETLGTKSASPPRERILAAARDLFYRHGIHDVGVDAIAEAAGTNKMTLYRHFASKDELVAECLRSLASELEARWLGIAAAHAGNPLGQLRAWLGFLAEYKMSERGCAFSNAAVELPDHDHPARRVIEAAKKIHREKLTELCHEAGLDEPGLVADQIFLLCEGARASLQTVGPNGPGKRLVEMLQSLVTRHAMRANEIAEARRPSPTSEGALS
jgi:AcrR family transcriptional regulator